MLWKLKKFLGTVIEIFEKSLKVKDFPKFVSSVKATQLFFTNDNEFFMQKKITFLANVAVGVTFLYYFPFDSKRFLCVLQTPNIFRQFCFVSSFWVSKGCLMISVTFLKVCCKSHVSLSSYCGLIYDICLRAFSFEWAIWFLSAITGVGLLRWCICFWKNVFVVWRDYWFHVLQAWVAQLKCVSVENLVEQIVLWKAFVDDVKELSTKVSFTVKPDVLLIGTLQCCGAVFQY